ncbi:MAG TPA: BlaI/MecI/CopY family transcriptional regulator [Candidatus Limnocylindrales bacterium]|nr:BlaI/MecI/CopY family transcriptional regulator [Candidatus Limnocylindrales bacterium]
MIRFLKNRLHTDHAERNSVLGSLETLVMEVLWARGQMSVRGVCERIESPRAYTTVMTTLERLFKKGLLTREKSGRAFLYEPAISRDEWQRRRAGSVVASFLDSPQAPRNLLVSTLLDAVGEHDEALLDELEKQIRHRRRELSGRGTT